MYLSDMNVGDKAIVKKIEASKNIKRRFCQMKIKSTTSKTSVTALLGSLKDWNIVSNNEKVTKSL